tara:strand:- start:860 stop:1063 length:204 start_codon:yes stop_codon:yes gene_type:complete
MTILDAIADQSDKGLAMQKIKQEILEEITLWAVSNFPDDVGEFLDLSDEEIQIINQNLTFKLFAKAE